MSDGVGLQDALTAFFLAHDYTQQSEGWYTEILGEFLTWLESQEVRTVDALTVEHLRSYIKWLQSRIGERTHRPLKSATVLGRARGVHSFLAFCVEEGWLSANTLARWRLPKEERTVLPVLTEDQMDRLFAAARQAAYPPLRLRDEALLALLVDTGGRVTELVMLAVGDVWLRPHEAHIRVHRKWRQTQDLPLGRRSRRMLHSYLTLGRPRLLALPPGQRAVRRRHVPAEQEPRVFLSRTGLPLNADAVLRHIWTLRDRAGAEHFRGVRVSPHTFRHTMAVNFLKQGGSIYELKLLLGHSAIKDTERYVRALERLDAGQQHSVLDRLARQTGGSGWAHDEPLHATGRGSGRGGRW